MQPVFTTALLNDFHWWDQPGLAQWSTARCTDQDVKPSLSMEDLKVRTGRSKSRVSIARKWPGMWQPSGSWGNNTKAEDRMQQSGWWIHTPYPPQSLSLLHIYSLFTTRVNWASQVHLALILPCIYSSFHFSFSFSIFLSKKSQN